MVALDLEGQLCLYDYITFYDGPTPESHRLLRLCDRSEIVTTVITSGNQIYLDFFSDDQQQFTGFTLEYEFQDQDYGQGECSTVQIKLISISNLVHILSYSTVNVIRNSIQKSQPAISISRYHWRVSRKQVPFLCLK